VASTGAEDNTLQILTESSTMKSVPAVVVLEATTVTVLEVPVMTSTLTDSVVGLVSAPSEMALTSTDIVRAIIKKGSRSAPTELAQPWTS